MEKSDEGRIYDNLVKTVDSEIEFLSEELVTSRDDPKKYGMHIGALFDLAKIYATLKDDFRSDKKAGIAA